MKIKYSDVFVPISKDLKLHGQYYFHSDSVEQKGLFVLFHGNAQNLSAHYLQFAWVLNRGYDLFVFDYPGYGKSEGKATRQSTILSGQIILDYISANFKLVPSKKLILVGESLGGAILLNCFVDWKDKDITTLLIAESTFPSYRAAARNVLAQNWITWPLQPLTYLLISEKGSPGPSLSKIAPTPLLVTTCAEDRVVSPVLSREMFKKAAEPKYLWEFQACGHIQTFQIHENRDKLIQFIETIKTKD